MADGDETYVGDGIYASFDGFMIKLRTTRDNGDHVIYMEPPEWATLEVLVRKWYADKLRKQYDAKQAKD